MPRSHYTHLTCHTNDKIIKDTQVMEYPSIELISSGWHRAGDAARKFVNYSQIDQKSQVVITQVKNTQVLVLLTSMFIFTLGFGIVIPVIAYFTKDMGATSFDVGILMSLFSAMEFVFAPLWGRMSDRVGRKPIMLTGLLGFGVFFALTGISTELWMVYLTQTLAGVFAAGIFPASQAYVADITTHEERMKMLGMMGAMMGLGMIIGPAISSVCAIWGLRVPFLFAAGAAIVTFAFALLFLPESRDRRIAKSASHPKLSMTSAIRTRIGGLLFLMLFVSFAMACVDGTMAYYIMDRFGMSGAPSSMPVLLGSLTLTGPNVTGIMFTCMGIIMIVCQGMLIEPIARRFGEKRTIVAGIGLVAAGMVMLLAIFDLTTLLLATCLISIGRSFVNPCVNTMVSKLTDPGSQGSAMGVLGSFNSLGRVMGPTVGGLVYMFSVIVLYLGTAAIAALCALGVTRWNRGQEDKIKVATLQEEHA